MCASGFLPDAPVHAHPNPGLHTDTKQSTIDSCSMLVNSIDAQFDRRLPLVAPLVCMHVYRTSSPALRSRQYAFCSHVGRGILTQDTGASASNPCILLVLLPLRFASSQRFSRHRLSQNTPPQGFRPTGHPSTAYCPRRLLNYGGQLIHTTLAARSLGLAGRCGGIVDPNFRSVQSITASSLRFRLPCPYKRVSGLLLVTFDPPSSKPFHISILTSHRTPLHSKVSPSTDSPSSVSLTSL